MSDEKSYAITRHKNGHDVVAWRAGTAITRDEFLADVAALISRLPGHRHVINLCTDRYRFMVSFAACLCSHQVSLLPSSDSPATLAALARDYPDLYILTDTPNARSTMAGVRTLTYPPNLPITEKTGSVPEIPGKRTAIILFTSGSTGQPVPVPKTWGVLVRSALAAGNRIGARQFCPAVIIGTVSHRHSYGLESVILLGLQCGMGVEAKTLLYPADIRAAINAAGTCVLVTTPVHLRVLVEEPEDMPPVALILSATSPLTTELAREAELCFSATLLEIYGCTEAGQVATRQTTGASSWHCLQGVYLDQRDGATWASGEVVQGDVLLHDVIEMTSATTFLLGGRSADMVDVAGKRVSLAHLNHVLLSIPGVRDGVFFMPAAKGGRVARLAALVVAPTLPPHEISCAIRERIDAAFFPRPLVFLDALPRNDMGKLPVETLIRLIHSTARDELA
ncbi:MAG: AMP-binding protein [Acidocella sp.]|nr:AMP-binding protein [Acidocella sp.]